MSLRRPRSARAALVAVTIGSLLLLSGARAYAAPGDLDPAFDSDGIATTPIGTVDQAFDVAIDSNDRVIVGGFAYNGSDRDFALVRYNADGSLDSTFSGDGRVVTDLGGLGGNEQINAIAVQPDDKIVVAGNTYGTPDEDFAVARYNADGTLDTNFSTDGYLTTDVGQGDDSAQGVAIDGAGNIVVAGVADATQGIDFALARYTPAGVLDTTFDGDGLLTTDVASSNDQANDVAVDANGKIVAVGWSTQGPRNKDFAIARYDEDGSLDTTFSSNGIVIVNGTDKAHAVALEPSGDIVVGGTIYDVQSHTLEFGLARYTSDGLPDGGFGTAGTGRVSTPIGHGGAEISSLAIDGQGRIVAGGFASNSTDRDFALALYAPDGSLETTFANGGKVLTPIGTNDSGRGVAIDSLGRFVVGGYAFTGSNSDFAAVRYATAGYRPDAMLRKGNQGTYAGDDVYDLTAKGQTVIATTKRLRTANFSIKLQDDGTGPDSLTVHGCGSANGFGVRYLDGATDVTSEVTAGTYVRGPLSVGASTSLTLLVKVGKAAVGRTLTCKLAASSQAAGTERDVIAAKVKGVPA
jgi:uncharacterized delta-60 repeat protein